MVGTCHGGNMLANHDDNQKDNNDNDNNAGDRFTWSPGSSTLHSGRRFTSHGVQNKFKIKVNILHCRDSKMMAAIKLKSLII